MTDFTEDNEATRRLDAIIRASWPTPPRPSFRGDELERKGLVILHEDKTSVVIASMAPGARRVVFRGTPEESVVFVIAQPDAPLPTHTDPLAQIRAKADTKLAQIAAGAALGVRKHDNGTGN